MRRLVALLLTAALCLTPSLAVAQGQIIGPGGVVVQSGASVSAVNTSSAITLFSYAVPAGLSATSSAANTPVYGASNPTVAQAALATWAPLHLTMLGNLSTSGTPGAMNLGCNYGGATATIAVVNGVTPQASLGRTPAQIDLWVSPIATATSGNIGGDTTSPRGGVTVWVMGRFAYQSGTTLALASMTTFNAAIASTTTLNTQNTLQCIWQWSTADPSNALILYQRTLVIGN